MVTLLYKTFAYFVLGRIEATFEAGTPRRTAWIPSPSTHRRTLAYNKPRARQNFALDVPVWIMSLDLSKAFDGFFFSLPLLSSRKKIQRYRAVLLGSLQPQDKWESLWEALREHGASDHMFWVVKRTYYGHTGRIEDNNADEDLFYIKGGVRQGCVLSPWLFSCVLEIALGCWPRKIGTAGVDFHDGMRTLLGPRFADVSANKIFVGRTGAMFSRTRATMECAKKNVDNSATKSERGAPSKGTIGDNRDRKFRGLTVALHINGWDACYAQRILAITLEILHITSMLRRKRSFANRPYLVNRNVAMQPRPLWCPAGRPSLPMLQPFPSLPVCCLNISPRNRFLMETFRPSHQPSRANASQPGRGRSGLIPSLPKTHLETAKYRNSLCLEA